MPIKVTKRHTGEYGCTYSISGLTFDQLFRIKQAMFYERERMKEIMDGPLSEHARLREDFERFRQDAHDVYVAVKEGCY